MNRNKIASVLNKPYDRLIFGKDILKQVFPTFKQEVNPVKAIVEPTASEKKSIDKVFIYGNIELSTGTEITCYEIILQPQVRIEQSRVNIRQYVRKILTTGEAALVNFIHPVDKSMWRFTLVAKDSDLTSEGVKEKETNAKRYTYLVEVGKDKTNRTLSERLEKLSQVQKQTLDSLTEAFSVENLSNTFFNEYKIHYDKFLKDIKNTRITNQKILNSDPQKAIRDFVKKTMGRLVFLYFVQRKQWLGASTTEYKDGDTSFLMNFFKSANAGNAFYNVWLKKLFFDTLNNNKRDNDNFKMPNGKTIKVPFLNGGLFDIEDIDNEIFVFNPVLFHNPNDSEIPEKRGFFDFLNAYNFTVYEDSPDDYTVAVDPEMLGHIFENLLEDSKDKGAYYTPKEVVHYMCQESLIEYLTTHLSQEYTVYKEIGNNQIQLFGNESNTGQLSLLEKVGNKALNHDDIAYIVRNKDISKLTDDQLKRMNKLLDKVSICDPAIGSGAFPMGLLQEIHGIKEIIALERNEDWVPATVKENIIQKSIYGVDLEKGAVDIARLRFWLSLIVEEEMPKPLPNLDYKIVEGNSLISIFINKLIKIDWNKKVSVGKADHFIKEISSGLSLLSQKQKKYFNTQDKERLSKEIRNLKIDILINQLLYDKEVFLNKNQSITDMGFGLKPSEIKNNLEISEKIVLFDNAVKKLRYLKNNPSEPLDFFDWELDFPEIMNKQIIKNAGFDIVIGNPPYVRADNPHFAEQREMIMQSGYYETLWEKWDLMVPFIEKGLKLLNGTGNFSFIVSNSITTSKFAYKIQDWIIDKYKLNSIDYFENIKVFDAGVIPVVLNISAIKNDQLTKKIIRSGSFKNKEVKEIKIDKTNPESVRATLFKKRFNEAFHPNIETIRLGNICYLSKGMVTNADEKTAQGEFVKNDLISDIKTDVYSKEYIEGKDIKAFKIEKIKYIEYDTERVPDRLSRPTFRELYNKEKIFRGRVTKGTYDNTGIVCNDSIIVIKRFTDLHGVDERSITSSVSKNNLDEDDKKKKGKTKAKAVGKKRIELENLSENYSLKYILAVINSKYAMAYLNNFRRHRLENYFYPDDFRNYPIPDASQEKQKILETLVDYLLYLNEDAVSHLPQKENILTSYFEQIIDGCVYELYFPEVLKKHNHEVFEHLSNLPSIDVDAGFEEIKTIADEFNRLYKPDHPLRKNLYYMDSLTEIRIVEGKHTH